jgi:hypothetical protein
MARNYLQAGMYREMFREKGVRLIFVNDNVDTFVSDDDFLPFREIMAEWYIRDCSRKVKSAYKTKGLSGKHISSHAIYGYKKSDADKNQWVIDEPAATVVRRIFDMTAEGFGPYAIATKLSTEKVECPSYYLAQRGWGHYKNHECADQYRWWGTTVGYLLSRLEYMGHTVNFKTTKQSYKSKRRYANARENWAVFENTHEAIIPPETWETANRLRAAAKRHMSDLGEPRPLTGLLYCADCGSKLYHERTSAGCAKPKDSYLCANYRKLTGDCTAHRISAKAVEALILETLRAVSRYAQTDETAFRTRVTEMFAAK